MRLKIAPRGGGQGLLGVDPDQLPGQGFLGSCVSRGRGSPKLYRIGLQTCPLPHVIGNLTPTQPPACVAASLVTSGLSARVLPSIEQHVSVAAASEDGCSRSPVALSPTLGHSAGDRTNAILFRKHNALLTTAQALSH